MNIEKVLIITKTETDKTEKHILIDKVNISKNKYR